MSITVLLAAYSFKLVDVVLYFLLQGIIETSEPVSTKNLIPEFLSMMNSLLLTETVLSVAVDNFGWQLKLLVPSAADLDPIIGFPNVPCSLHTYKVQHISLP